MELAAMDTFLLSRRAVVGLEGVLSMSQLREPAACQHAHYQAGARSQRHHEPRRAGALQRLTSTLQPFGEEGIWRSNIAATS